MRTESIQILLAVAISSFIVIFPAYLRYADLSETDLSSADLIFENPDQDDQINDQQHESDARLINLFSTIFPQKLDLLLNPFSHFLPAETSENQKTSVLRC